MGRAVRSQPIRITKLGKLVGFAFFLVLVFFVTLTCGTINRETNNPTNTNIVITATTSHVEAISTAEPTTPAPVPTTQAPVVPPTTYNPPPPKPKTTPTLTGIKAGQFCKRIYQGKYAYDSNGNLLFCGPVGVTHPRWWHA